MQIQILSDLHLEVERSNATPGWTLHDQLFDWLKTQLKLFKVVFFLMGNHEPYRSSISDAERRLTAFAAAVHADSSLGRFVFLNRTRYDISPTLTVLGCTLWSALNPADIDILSISLNDFRRIEFFTPEAYNSVHQRDLHWLNSAVSQMAEQEPAREIIVFTHHSPTVRGTGHPKYDEGPTNSAFATELTGEDCWKSGRIKLWAFGHTHWCCDFERGGVRLYSNQRGYGDGTFLFDAEKTVDI